EVRAKENAELANLERQRAELNEKEAISNAERARQEELRARELRYRAIAKAMAIKSVQLNDAEQQALLAQQGYNFNKLYHGYVYDNDIYDGLYNALKKYNDPLTISLTGHKNSVRTLATRLQGNQIYSAGTEGRILHWTYRNGKWVSDELVPEAAYRLISSIDISPDGNLLIAAGNFNNSDPSNNFVEIYNLKNPKEKPNVIYGFKGEVGDVHFTPNSKGFFARDNEGHSIRYSDLSTVREVINVKE